MFNRPELTATGVLGSGIVTVDVTGWRTTPAVDGLYSTSQVNANTGATSF